jgi:pyrimidine-nucleoside phosphorylase
MNNQFLPAEIIKKKRNGFANSKEEISWLINEYTNGNLPDYQMSAWLMAVYFQNMTPDERLHLTTSMLKSGKVLSFPQIKQMKIDKHSTGGVGDKTSIILGPIVAACNVTVPMISGRGLGHTGGTLDKLESIPGFNTQLNLNQFAAMLENQGLSFIGQTVEVCPADKKIYALRDVTATVESLPLICASIMSKKLAEGIEGLVLDVKYGNGAFMKSIGDAEELAKALKQIGEDAGKKVIALITNMNQPLGSYIGNSLEIHECIEILQNKKNLNTDGLDLYSDCRELSLELAAYMVWIANPLKNLEQCRTDVNESLTSGKAYKKFLSVCSNQGGEIEKLPKSLFNITICSQRDGYIKSFNTEKIGISAIKIGAGRLKVTDKLDPSAGIQIHKKIGSKVANGDLLFTVYGNSLNILRAQESSLYECIEWSNIMVDKQILISNVLI